MVGIQQTKINLACNPSLYAGVTHSLFSNLSSTTQPNSLANHTADFFQHRWSIPTHVQYMYWDTRCCIHPIHQSGVISTTGTRNYSRWYPLWPHVVAAAQPAPRCNIWQPTSSCGRKRVLHIRSSARFNT